MLQVFLLKLALLLLASMLLLAPMLLQVFLLLLALLLMASMLLHVHAVTGTHGCYAGVSPVVGPTVTSVLALALVMLLLAPKAIAGFFF